MADKISTSEDLLIDNLFVDGDTRRITLKNPESTIEAATIAELNTFILNGGQSTILIGDKTQAPFRRINKVTKRITTTVDLDLST